MVSYTTPIIAGIFTDVYLGRFKTVLFSYGIYLLGTLILFITSLPPLLNYGAGLPGLIVALTFTSIGLGAIKASMPPYVAEQCSNIEDGVKTLPSGETVIISKQATIEYVFNLYYWTNNMGTLARIAATFIEKDVAFWAAFLIGLCSLSLGLLTLLMNKRRLIEVERQASALVWAAKALKMIVLKRLKINIAGRESIPWSEEYVQQLKSGLKVCHVFLPFIVYWLCQSQMTTNTVSQAANMETHGVPNDILPAIDAFTVIVMIPILNHVLYPFLRKRQWSFTPIARIAVGLAFESFGMAWAAGVQAWIYASPPCYWKPRACAASNNGVLPNNVNVAFQIPVYVFEGLGEAFAVPAVYDHAFNNSPKDLKSVVQGIYVSSAALGSGIGLALSPTYRDPELLYMYAGLAAAMMAVMVLFLLAFHRQLTV